MALSSRSSMAPSGVEIQLKRKQDVFDNPDFQPIQFVNNLYPDESSLTDLDKFIAVLKKQITSIDKEIFQAVRAQGGAHTRARQELESAQQQIAELTSRIKAIQRKADESENMVQEICKDIRKLDYAKQHLTNGITALRRLAMLTAAVADLEGSAGRRDQYKKSANLLEAVHQLMEYFQQYEDIPKVKSLASRLAQLEAKLTENVLDDFKSLLGTVDIKVSPENLDRLAAGCLVVDALGPRVRDQLLDWLCDREMNIYQLFSSSGGADVSKLDRFDRRFHWFRTRQEERKAEWSIFPEQWRVPQVLCLMFCKITKAHLKRVLSDDESAQGGLRTDIGPLIKAVVATNKFEKDMATLFGGGTDLEEDDLADPQSGPGGDEVSASEARKRLERMRHKQKQQEARRQMDQMGEKARAEREAVRTTFEGAISEAFEPSLHMYVAEEEKELHAYLEGLLREEAEHHWKPTDEEVDARILPSANKLFLKVRSSLTRCVKMISRGPTLLALTQVFKRVLATYCQALHHRLPKTVNGQTSVAPPFQGVEWHVRLPEDEERVTCHILHTAEFCVETLDALATACQKDIKPALADQVDMGDEQSAFQSLGGACMSVLALGINTRLDVALQELGRVRWDLVDSPGDDSIYVSTIRKVLLEVAPRLGALLDTTTLSFLCDKTMRTFVPRFQDAVGKCKRISDKGTLQLSIDCDAVRRVLHEFPKAAMEARADKDAPRHADLLALQGAGPREEEGDESGPFAGYHAYVEREMGSLINMVKVLQSKAENLVDTFLLLMPVHHQDINEFARVCEMKGLSRQQQQQLFQAYQLKTSGTTDPLAASAALTNAAGGGLAANLGAFKINMNNITALASNISFPKMGVATPSSPAGPGNRGGLFARTLANPGLGPAGGAGHQRTTSISTAAENMATKTKDTFAKVGNFMGTGFSKIGTAFGQQQSQDGSHS